ncbi:MAG: signal peptidase I [Clostridiaceae bacterium]|nr:signal peptidase I [Clostridiaceae bacterium]
MNMKNTDEIENNEKIEMTSEQPKPQINWKKEFFDWTEAIVIAVVIAVIIRSFFFTLVAVEGASMENTLHTGDRLFVRRLGYTPKNGDIIVFTPENKPNTPYIKRAIAIENQVIDIDYSKGIVMLDGEILDEEYIKVPTKRPGDVQFPVTVPEGHFFAMGDNRGNSHDSRNSDVGSSDNKSGLVKNETLIGKAVFRIWPLSGFGFIK